GLRRGVLSHGLRAQHGCGTSQHRKTNQRKFVLHLASPFSRDPANGADANGAKSRAQRQKRIHFRATVLCALTPGASRYASNYLRREKKIAAAPGSRRQRRVRKPEPDARPPGSPAIKKRATHGARAALLSLSRILAGP